jgi:sulfoxide reductase heme-binding subunit YedZ
MRLSGRAIAVIGAVIGLITIVATGQIAPAASEYQAQLRVWLAARATGITAYIVLTLVVALGLILSHPVNQSTWKLSRRLFPWHENLFVFIVAFVILHVVAIVLDPYAGVGIGGAIIPGLSSYRTVPVAIGNIALYALLVAAITARYTKLLPPGVWLKLHRASLLIWALAWGHGMLSGTDTEPMTLLYVGSGLIMVGAAGYRYWVSRQRRPTFATSLPDEGPAGRPEPRSTQATAPVGDPHPAYPASAPTFVLRSVPPAGATSPTVGGAVREVGR